MYPIWGLLNFKDPFRLQFSRVIPFPVYVCFGKLPSAFKKWFYMFGPSLITAICGRICTNTSLYCGCTLSSPSLHIYKTVNSKWPHLAESKAHTLSTTSHYYDTEPLTRANRLFHLNEPIQQHVDLRR